jgi:hypothetical protein
MPRGGPALACPAAPWLTGCAGLRLKIRIRIRIIGVRGRVSTLRQALAAHPVLWPLRVADQLFRVTLLRLTAGRGRPAVGAGRVPGRKPQEAFRQSLRRIAPFRSAGNVVT